MVLNRPRADATPDKPVRAAGAVLWRPGPDGPQVALIHRPRYDDWSLPKGKADPGEHPLLTAVREVFEETARRVVLGRRLPSISYRVLGGSKRVRYWAGRALPEGEGSGAFVPNHEVDKLVWLDPEEARGLLTRPLDETVLEAFLRTPADTVPIVLLRHGTAQHRGPDYSDDLIRPLAAQGHTQAEAMAGLLPCYGPLRIVSSPAVRCVDTVRPFARKEQITMNFEPVLSEQAHASAPDAAAAWIRAVIAEGWPTVVCSHRAVLDSMMAAVLDDVDRRPLPRHAPSMNGRAWSKQQVDRLLGADRGGGLLKPGRAWVLHVAARREPGAAPWLVAVDRLKP